MPHRPNQPPGQQQPGGQPVSQHPPSPHPNPWNFLVTKKTTHCELIAKRELFAAMAMQGILSDSEYNEPVERLASSSVRAADALIAELAKSTEQNQ